MNISPQIQEALRRIDTERTNREDVIISEYRKKHPYGDIPKELFEDLKEEMMQKYRAILE